MLEYLEITLSLITESRAWKIGSSILVGVVGTLILAAFVKILLPVAPLTGFMPWFIGFNAALTGYMLLDKTRDRLPCKRLFALGSGFFLVVLVCLAWFLVLPPLIGLVPLSWQDVSLWLGCGLCCSWLGGSLAIKYFQLT